MPRQPNVPIKPRDTASKLTTALAVVIMADIAIGSFIIFHDSFNKPKPQPITVAIPTGPSMNNIYKDGNYTSTINYMSSDGQEGITVNLKLDNDEIMSTTATPMFNNPVSESYLNKFIAAYQPYVVGKKLNTISLSTVAGASASTKAFNKAILDIQTQAKV